MTRLTSSPAAVRSAEPRVLWTPPSPASSAGREAVDLAASVGLHLDPWQQLVLDHALAEDDRGRWSAFEVGLCVPRQNGKSAVLEARILAGMFLFDEELIIYSAHLYDTATEVLRRLEGLIDGSEWMRKRVKLNRGQVAHWSHGNEGIELLNGHRVRFKTRTKGGGRGLSGDCVILDEAMYLTGEHTSALVPTMAARSVTGNPQMWYAGSAGNDASVVFGGARNRALAGGDPSLCWLEWSVDEAGYARALHRGRDAVTAFETDPGNIAQANPGLEVRISLEHCLTEQRTMSASPLEYAKERLGVGQWPVESSRSGPVSRDAWVRAADPESALADPVVFAVSVSLDGSHTAVGASGSRSDGARGVEVVEHRPGTHWAAARVAELLKAHPGSRAVLDAGSRANQLVPGLVEAGVPVHSGKGDPPAGCLVLLGGQDVTAAFGGFVSDVTADPPLLRHRPHPALDVALDVATTRYVGQSLAWDGKNLADISPLVTVTLAAHGHAKFGASETEGWVFFE